MILGKVGTHIAREWNWIKALSARPKTIKPLGETGENLLDIDLDTDFLDTTSKTQIIKAKI